MDIEDYPWGVTDAKKLLDRVDTLDFNNEVLRNQIKAAGEARDSADNEAYTTNEKLRRAQTIANEVHDLVEELTSKLRDLSRTLFT